MSENRTSGLAYIDVNLHEVDAWDGAISLVNPGEYILRCDDVKQGQSKSGKPKMVLTYTVVEALNEENEDMVGRTIIQSQSLDFTSDAVKGRVKSLILALCGEVSKRGGFSPDDFFDKEMLCEVVAQTYTEQNPITNEPIEKNTISIIRERPVSAADEKKAATAEPPPPEAANGRSSRGRGRRGSRAQQ